MKIYHFYDFDDTLALTKQALYMSYKKALNEYGIDFEFPYFNDFIYSDANKYLADECGFSETEIIEIKKRKEFYYLNDYFHLIEWNLPSNLLYNERNKIVIITNTSADLVKTLVDKKFGIEVLSKIDVIGSYSSTSTKKYKRKPDPELYIEAFRKFVKTMEKDDVLHIYEDSAEGLSAAALFLLKFKKRLSQFQLHHVTKLNININE